MRILASAAVTIVLLTGAAWLSPFRLGRVQGMSMLPGLRPGQWIVYRSDRIPVRGSRVVVRGWDGWQVKRLIGMANETVVFDRSTGAVQIPACLRRWIDDGRLDPDGIWHPVLGIAPHGRWQERCADRVWTVVLDRGIRTPISEDDRSQTVTLGADEVFVAGDNRPLSDDGRRRGPVTRGQIEGIVVFPSEREGG